MSNVKHGGGMEEAGPFVVQMRTHKFAILLLNAASNRSLGVEGSQNGGSRNLFVIFYLITVV